MGQTMKHRFTFGARPLGVAASATLAIGAAGALPAQLAFASPSPSASVANGILSVEGTPGVDTITLGIGADPSTLLVDFGTGATPASFARSTFTAISVSLGPADDNFSVNSQGQFNNVALTIDGGPGNDMIRGSNGNDVIFSGPGDDNVDGGRGTDTEVLGPGSDTALWLPGEGSDVVNGDSGQDALDFIGAAGNEVFGLTPSGSHALLTRDLGGITMDTDGVEEFDLATLAGTDSVTVGDLSGTQLRTANLDLSSAGASDGVLDTVVVNGSDHADQVAVTADGSAIDVSGLHTTTRISGNDTRDQLHVNTGNGNDSVTVSDAAAALIATTVDLGNDQL